MASTKKYPDKWIEHFIAAAARLAWSDWWANMQEEKGKIFPPGTDLYVAAPQTPEWALVWAGMMVGQYEALNKMSIYGIAGLAHVADGGRRGDGGIAVAEDFGVALAFMALGHGVSWFDDHNKFPLKVPHMEFYAG